MSFLSDFNVVRGKASAFAVIAMLQCKSKGLDKGLVDVTMHVLCLTIEWLLREYY